VSLLGATTAMEQRLDTIARPQGGWIDDRGRSPRSDVGRRCERLAAAGLRLVARREGVWEQLRIMAAK